MRAAPALGTTSFNSPASGGFTTVSLQPSPASVNYLGYNFVSATSNTGSLTHASSRVNIVCGAGSSATYAAFGSDNGSEFKALTLNFQVTTASYTGTLTATGYKDGSAVSGATTTFNVGATGTAYAWDFSSLTAFQNVDQVRISGMSGTGSFSINSINIAAAVVATTPTITTPTSLSFSGTTATLGGNVTADGGAAITERGVVYAITTTNNNPQISGTGVTKVTASGTTGVFTANASSLTPGTGYSFAAYATNSVGTTYTGVGTFTTLSNNVNLASLSLSNGAGISPAVAPGTLTYSASVAYAVTSVSLTATAAHASAGVRINGTATNVGSRTESLALNVGVNSIPVLITAEDGSTAISYTVNITRAFPAAPTVTTPTSASITASTATLGGNVTADGGDAITERGVVYAITTANNNPQLNGNGVVKSTASGTTGVFTVNVSSLTPGTGYSFAAYASNSTGTTYTTPVSTFTTLSNNASLAALSLSNGASISPAIAPGVFSYSATVANAVTSVSLTATSAHAAATVRINGGTSAVGSSTATLALPIVGVNTFPLTVMAEDGTQVSYTFNVIRSSATAPTVTTPTSAGITGTTATLGGNVTTDGGDTVTERGVVYAITTANNNPQINGSGVTKVTASGTTGVFTVGATGLTAGTGYSFAAYAINNTGTTYTTPVSTFTTLSDNANLAGLTLSSGTLSPVFASGTTSYTAEHVLRPATSVTLTATVAEPHATLAMRVNGGGYAAAISGSAGPSLPLNLGDNTLDVRVTAEDGVTQKTYSVALRRLTYLEAWRRTHYATIANAGNAANDVAPQFDGIANLMKFALSMDPALSGVVPIVFVKNGSTLEFTYPRSIEATVECTFIVEWSDTLIGNDWSVAGVTEQIMSATSTVQQVKASLPDGGGPRRFVRLRLTTP
ncbi:MAG: beta strand repeat-containing protein [Prosthecobacter sp.]